MTVEAFSVTSDPSGGFEGPEKRLEADLAVVENDPVGLRRFSTDEWQYLLTFANCTILQMTQNGHVDAYLLSESSLFVYPYKIVLKTCGTTTLLQCIPVLAEYAAKIGSQIESVLFCRKNYMYPSLQPEPHCDFGMETEFIRKYFHGIQRTLGSGDEDHFCIFSSKLHPCATQSMEIMMHDLDRDVMQQFYQTPDMTAQLMTEKTGISGLLCGATHVDPYMFTPMGYSLNALKNDAHFTIHITPEEIGSFVSYETNIRLDSYAALSDMVIRVFKPKRFCLVITKGVDSKYAVEDFGNHFPQYSRQQSDHYMIHHLGIHFWAFSKA